VLVGTVVAVVGFVGVVRMLVAVTWLVDAITTPIPIRVTATVKVLERKHVATPSQFELGALDAKFSPILATKLNSLLAASSNAGKELNNLGVVARNMLRMPL